MITIHFCIDMGFMAPGVMELTKHMKEHMDFHTREERKISKLELGDVFT